MRMRVRGGVVLYLFLVCSLLQYVLKMHNFDFIFFNVFSCCANGILEREGIQWSDEYV